MDSTSNSTKAETIQEEEHSPSSFLIGIIVVSVFVGVCLIAVTYLLVRRMQVKKNRGEIEIATEKPTDTTATTSSSSAIVTTASTKNEKRPTSVAPIVSSLDTNDIFFSILEHPPRPPPMTVRNNLDHLSPVMFEEGYCLNSAFTDFNSLHSDPISASLARQREDRRMSYYITPSSLSQTNLNDEKQLMRQLSVSSYQVW
jgi:hypothetical protein